MLTAETLSSDFSEASAIRASVSKLKLQITEVEKNRILVSNNRSDLNESPQFSTSVLIALPVSNSNWEIGNIYINSKND